jgi:16S rRNA (guanine527-N7)-methyltransferase
MQHRFENLMPAIDLLRKDGIFVDEAGKTLLATHTRFIREYNEVAGFVSTNDLDHLEERHVSDALSLAPPIQQITRGNGILLDIGSGGGFPAIPLKAVFPALRVIMIERSEKKADILHHLLQQEQIAGLDLVRGEFSAVIRQQALPVPDLITARAIEKPAKAHRAIGKYLREGMVFLCQTPASPLEDGLMFHVEQVRDRWTESGLRRGGLKIIRRKPE